MNSKTLIVLALVLAVLIALVVLKQGRQQPPSIIEQVGLVKLTLEDLDAASIMKIELYQGAQPDQKVTIEREKSDAPWRVTSHFNAPAVADTVGDYLASVLGLQGEHRDDASTDERLARYELKDDQAFHVAVYKAGAETPAHHVLVGKSEGMATTFVRRAGAAEVYSEKTDLRRDAGVYVAGEQPTASKWLDKTIAKVEDGVEITRLACTLPDKRLVFERRAKEQPKDEDAEDAEDADAEPKPEPPVEYEWVLAEGGPGTPHKDSSLQSTLSRFKNLTARDIADPEKRQEYGLDAPAYRTEITLDNERTITLEGARPNKTGNGYVRVAGAEQEILYELDSYTFEQVFPKCGQLFELPKLGEGLKLDELNRVVVSQEDGSNLVVEKTDGKWAVIEPKSDLKTQDATLSTLASTLLSWTAADYADEGADIGAFTRTVTITVGDQTRAFGVGGDSKCIDGLYTRIGDAGPTLVMSRTDAKKLLLTPRDVYQLTVLDVEEAQVKGLNLHVGDKQFVLEKTEDAAWQALQDGVARAVEEGTVSGLITRVIGFQADNLRLDVARLEGDPAARFEVTMEDGTVHAIAFAPEQDGVQLMTVSGISHGLTAKPSDVQMISGMMDTILTSLAEPPPAPPEETAEEAADVEAPQEPPVNDAADTTDDTPVEVALPPLPTPLTVETPGAAIDAPVQVELPQVEVAPAEVETSVTEVSKTEVGESASAESAPEPEQE